MASQAAPARWGFAESFYALVIVVSISLLAALFGSVYYWVNLTRVSDACSKKNNSSYSFSITHGFTCRYGNGKSESKFWW